MSLHRKSNVFERPPDAGTRRRVGNLKRGGNLTRGRGVNLRKRWPAPRRPGVNGMPHLSELLRASHTIAVVGLSSKRHRPSYGVAEYMQSAGYQIIPVNPFEADVLGEKAYAELEAVPGRVDIVDIF